jgi:putative endonuclease
VDNWWIYIVEKKGELYVGITTDLPNRMRQHGPTESLYREGPMSKSEALKRERVLKGWRREKKLALIAKVYSLTIVSLSSFALLRTSSLREGSPSKQFLPENLQNLPTSPTMD